MSHILSQHELVKFQKVVPGDLVCFEDHDERAIGIALKKDEDFVLVGVLQSSFDLPRLLQVPDDVQCIKYGTGWSIEPLDTATVFPAPLDTKRRAGLIALSPGGWFMNFASSNIDGFGRFDFEWWDLNTFQPSPAGLRRGALYDRWRLWSPEKDREHPGAFPVLDYAASPTEVR